ncbi:CST complex subunit TEN1-like [Lissotriton helveticus]
MENKIQRKEKKKKARESRESTGGSQQWRKGRDISHQRSDWMEGEASNKAESELFAESVNLPAELKCETRTQLNSYNLAESRATLTAQHNSTQQQISVGTNLVEPWCAQLGSVYMALGEVDLAEGGLPMLQARVLTCVDGIDLPLLERAVLEQRKYLGIRGGHGKSKENP